MIPRRDEARYLKACLNWSYGVEYLRGVWDHLVLGRRRRPRAVHLTR